MRYASFRFVLRAFGVGLVVWTGLVAPFSSAVAQVPSGTVVAWGGSPGAPVVTNVPAGLTNVIALAAGSAHSLALKADGTVVAWGINIWGQTNVPTDLSNVVAIAGGSEHSLALKADGKVVAWGRTNGLRCAVPTDLDNVIAIAGGGEFSVALRKDGVMVTWGANPVYWPRMARGAIGVAASTTFQGPVVLNKDGGVIQNKVSVLPLVLTNLIVVAGENSNLGLRRDGTVVGWTGTALDTVPAGLSNIAGIDCGMNIRLALKSDGTVVRWGNGTTVPRELTNVIAVAAGDNHGLAIKSTLPAFVVQPLSQVVSLGGTAVFHTTSVGTAPPQLQWQCDGSDIPGATNASLIISNAQASAMGSYHCVLRDVTGTATSRLAVLRVVPVCAWGSEYTSVLSEVSEELTNAVAVVCGLSHNLALKSDGTVFAWGDNSYGQTAVPAGLTNVVSVAGGGGHSLAALSDGTVVAWGTNSYGQTDVPSGLTNVIAVAAGTDHSLALTGDGHVIAWGRNDKGQASVPSSLNSAIQIAAGPACSLALTTHGWVTGWGQYNRGSGGMTTWSKMVGCAVGEQIVFGLKDTGKVLTSTTSYGSPNLSNVVAIAAGGSYASSTETCLGLRGDGTLTFWRASSGYVSTIPLTNWPAELRNVTALSASGEHALALLGNGSPHLLRQSGNITPPLCGAGSVSVTAVGASPVQYQWLHDGTSIDGATNAVLTLSNLQTSLDGGYTVLISNTFGAIISSNIDITVVPIIVWDHSYQYQDRVPSDIHDVVAISAGQQMKALLPDGTVRSWGWKAEPPPGLSNVIAMAGANLHSLALRQDGTVVAWGDAAAGAVYVPEGLTNVIAIAAGDSSYLALREDGTVIQWGGDTNSPPDLTNVVAVSCGYDHSLALRQDGTVVAWGLGKLGPTNVPPDLSQVVAIAAGWEYSLALKSDGSVVAWGTPARPAHMPAGISNVIAIGTYASDCMALAQDGTLLTWDAQSPYTRLNRSYANIVAISAGAFSMALVSTNPAAFSPSLQQPLLDGGSFSVSVLTRSGKVYLLEYKDSLDSTAWTPLPLVAGNGRTRTLTAPAANGTQRFYRVRQY